MSKEIGFRFSHIGIFATNLPKMEEFYTSILEFTVTDRGNLSGPDGPVELVFMSKDPEEHHQIVLVSGRPDIIDFNIINQISLKGDTIQSLQDMYVRLTNVNAQGLSPVTHGNSLSLYVLDPEGNRIELYVDMPWYVTQPMRVPINLMQEESALMKEVECHALSLPGFQPRSVWVAAMKKKMGIK